MVSNFLSALRTIYPEHQQVWNDWESKTPSHPYGYWKDRTHQRRFFDQLAVKLKIEKPEDWMKFTSIDVKKEGGGFITNYYNSSLSEGNNFSFT